MKRCLYCGFENSDTAEFCEKCGNQLLDNVVSTGSDPFEVPTGTQEPAAEEPEQEEAAQTAPEEGAAPEESNEQAPAADTGFDEGEGGLAYNAPDYGYAAQATAQQNYDGQAYGYSASDFPDTPTEDEEEAYVPQNRNLLRTRARKMIKNPLFFLAALAYTASVVLGILNIVTGAAITNIATLSNTLRAQLGDVTALKYVDIAYKFITEKDQLLVRGIGVLAYIPGLMIAIALWMIFFQTTNKSEQINTSGFTFARVLKILEFIVVCFGLLAAIGVSVYNVVTTAAAKEEVFMLFLCIIALLVVILLSVLTIMYYLQLIFAIKLVRTNCKTGDNIGRFPGFVIFVTFLGFVAQVASILPKAPDDYIGLGVGAASAAWLLLITIWAIVYRSVVKNR